MDDQDFDARLLAVDGPFRLPRALWRAAAGRRPAVVAYLAILVGAQLVTLAIPLLFGKAVDAVRPT
jgi:hypothetical protein